MRPSAPVEPVERIRLGQSEREERGRSSSARLPVQALRRFMGSGDPVEAPTGACRQSGSGSSEQTSSLPTPLIVSRSLRSARRRCVQSVRRRRRARSRDPQRRRGRRSRGRRSTRAVRATATASRRCGASSRMSRTSSTEAACWSSRIPRSGGRCATCSKGFRSSTSSTRLSSGRRDGSTSSRREWNSDSRWSGRLLGRAPRTWAPSNL
jgi:hypothetical protein